VPVDKPTISMDVELRAAASRLADAEGISFSAFVSAAVRDAVDRREASMELLCTVAEWEHIHGVLSDADVHEAAAELGLAPEPATAPRRVRPRGNR
jgi:hypothetical protein